MTNHAPYELPAQYNEVTAISHGRLHWGLLDCGDASSRVFGGIGSVIGHPTDTSSYPVGTTVRVVRSNSDTISVMYDPEHPELTPGEHFSDRDHNTVVDIAQRIRGFAAEHDKPTPGLEIYVDQALPEHMGLGSGTALRAAVAYAIGTMLLVDTAHHELNHDIAAQFISRGGTSRIGMLACQGLGEVIFDDGHPEPRGNRIFLPSSRRLPVDVPSANATANLGSRYRVSLYYDKDSPRIHGQQEVDLFTQHLPLPELENLNAIAAAYHGILPALLRRNMEDLTSGLKRLQKWASRR